MEGKGGKWRKKKGLKIQEDKDRMISTIFKRWGHPLLLMDIPSFAQHCGFKIRYE